MGAWKGKTGARYGMAEGVGNYGNDPLGITVVQWLVATATVPTS